MKNNVNPFDDGAERYDNWFESASGKFIFSVETKCLSSLLIGTSGEWLEIGVGTGRFAEALGIKEGVDPSKEVLNIAKQRGIITTVGTGEALSYPSNYFDGILMVVTICFLENPNKALEEAAKVLKKNGVLVLGLVPANSSWGKFYLKKKTEGHFFYSAAKFYTLAQVLEMTKQAGFTLTASRSCLFNSPLEELTDRSISKDINIDAGFIGMKFHRTQAPS